MVQSGFGFEGHPPERPTTTSTTSSDSSSIGDGFVTIAVLAGTMIASTVGWVFYRRK